MRSFVVGRKLLLRPLDRLRNLVMSICLSMCLSVHEDISGTTRAIFTKFLCVLPISVARSSSDTFTIGCIACRREMIFFPLKMHYLQGKGMGVHSAGEVCYLRLPCQVCSESCNF